MISISFIGDIMLGRFISDKYENDSYSLVSKAVLDKMSFSDCIIANLESPIVRRDTDDSLKFAGNPELLDQFRWINCFSLSNNHINDFGTSGMKETISSLVAHNLAYNGLFTDHYTPFLINKDGERIAVIMCTDMMNHEFETHCPYKTLRMSQTECILSIVEKYKADGYLIILYLHAGMLFSRYLNPPVRDFAHNVIRHGVSLVVTSHSHCLGGYEVYNDSLIINSLGDFLMDGSSYRRRKASILNIKIDNSKIIEWEMIPVITSSQLQTTLPSVTESNNMLKSIKDVAHKIERNKTNYKSFFKRQYKVEMLQHSASTLKFEYKKRGLWGFFRILWVRLLDVRGMIKKIFTDRSKMSYDSDAVKSMSNKRIK